MERGEVGVPEHGVIVGELGFTSGGDWKAPEDVFGGNACLASSVSANGAINAKTVGKPRQGIASKGFDEERPEKGIWKATE
jgi:hypothetical protein